MPLNIHFEKADKRLVELGIHLGRDAHRFDYEEAAAKFQHYVKKNDYDNFYASMQALGEEDFFAFCYFVLDLPLGAPGRGVSPYLVARCYEIEDNHNKTLYLWARESWKSTLITKALTIWIMIHKPESTQGIFCHTRAMAKNFLNEIKMELESNTNLHNCWPHIFYENPKKEGIPWSLESGLFIKRKRNVKEAAVEANGLVDGLPVGKHYSHRIYDDPIEVKNVTTPAQMKKAWDAYQHSVHLGRRGGEYRIVGTRYSSGDIYEHIIKQGGITVRIYPSEVDNKGKALFGGIPVFWSREELDEKAMVLDEFNYSSQMLQDPTAKSEQKFRSEWVRHYNNTPNLNYYMLVDPSGKKGKKNDYTVICVIGVDTMRNYFLVDMVRDKLNLSERWEKLKMMVEKWGISTEVGYESYGMQADEDYIRERMEAEGFYFTLVPLGGSVPKNERIKRLVPLFSKGRFFLPYSMTYVDSSGNFHDLISEFLIEEYSKFPFGANDDMLDCMARIMDGKMNVTFPTGGAKISSGQNRFNPLSSEEEENLSWMAL